MAEGEQSTDSKEYDLEDAPLAENDCDGDEDLAEDQWSEKKNHRSRRSTTMVKRGRLWGQQLPSISRKAYG